MPAPVASSSVPVPSVGPRRLRPPFALLTGLLVLGGSAVSLGAQSPSPALRALLDAEDSTTAAIAARAATEEGISFERAFAALAAGPRYGRNRPVGRVQGVRTGGDGTSYPYFLQVPESYDPERRYPVRVFLHGGVSRPPWDAQETWWSRPSRVASDDYIGLFPAAWRERMWWTDAQSDNLRSILREVGRAYNIDENRISLIGVSDGGTGAWWFAFRDTTPWASFLPFIGHPAVLLNPNLGVDGPVFRTNLTNKPFYVVNGDQDRLYPTRAVDPFIEDFAAAGVDVTYRRMSGFGHETTWWPDEAERIDAFVRSHPRTPHPARVVWETATADRAARAHWVRIDEIGYTAADVRFDRGGPMDPGVPGARIEVEREGNHVRIRSEGVARATLLVAPDVFDLAKPVTVEWNGREVFRSVVEASIEVLARWWAHDRDRTLLYAAELRLEAPRMGSR